MAVYDALAPQTACRPSSSLSSATVRSHPVVSNATEAGKARNRRIEMVIYPERIQRLTVCRRRSLASR